MEGRKRRVALVDSHAQCHMRVIKYGLASLKCILGADVSLSAPNKNYEIILSCNTRENNILGVSQ